MMRQLCGLALLLTVTGSTLATCSGQPVAKTIEDSSLTVPQLIEKNEYPVEVHHVETQDGYILEMHRIPYGRAEGAGLAANKPMVFVQHGLLSSSAVWVIAGPQKGLAYLLADRGYDVWMGNARGNKYSRQHKKLQPSGSKFWNFSWHEIGVYDLPAMIDYALQHSGQDRTFYIGHSQGTTAFYVMCAERPEYNSKIRAHLSLAPLVYMNHLYSPLLKFVAQFTGPLSTFYKYFGMEEFMPSNGVLTWIGDTMCSRNSMSRMLCTNTLFMICGFNDNRMNTELLPVIMGHTPAGASTRQIVHYGQLIKSDGKFQQYDHGLNNIMTYGQQTPPSYDLKKVTAPVALFYSENDWLAAETDVLKLYNELPNVIGRFQVTDNNFTNLDYLWAKDVDTLVYNKVFSLMTIL